METMAEKIQRQNQFNPRRLLEEIATASVFVSDHGDLTWYMLQDGSTITVQIPGEVNVRVNQLKPRGAKLLIGGISSRVGE